MSERGATFAGKPCRNCDGRERYVATKRCVRCERERVRGYQAALGDVWRARNREQMRRYRSDPVKRAKDNMHRTARSNALERLAREHPEEFNRYVDIERAVLGLPVRVAS